MKKIIVCLIIVVSTIFVSCNYQPQEEKNNTFNESIENTQNDIENDLTSDITTNEKENKDEAENPLEDDNDNIVEVKVEVNEVIEVSNNGLDNSTCAWGFVRKKDGISPEFSAKYTKPLDDYDGIYIGNKENKYIYLTFDEGYENGYTSAILDTLKEKNVTATFFVTMPYVKQNSELVQRMIDEGHVVGNHTVNHPSMPSVTDDQKLEDEVTKLHDYIKENFRYDMEFLRPPKGEYSERTVKICKDLGYRNVLWSSAYDDWDTTKQDRLDYARKMIYDYVHNGCVMLLHAVSKDNTALLGEVIDTLRERGYEFKSLEDFEY